MAWQPTWQLLVAFSNSAADDPALITTVAAPAGTLGAVNVWTDITADVRTNLDTNRGRQHEIDRVQPGTMTLTLDNRTGRYDTWNTAGPYTGKVLPGKPVRLQATFAGVTSNIYTGVSDTWATQWTSPSYSLVALSCVDRLAWLTNTFMGANMYATAIAHDNPTAWWKLNEQSGSVLADSSGNGRNATATGGWIYAQTGGVTTSADTATRLYDVFNVPAQIFLPASAFPATQVYSFEAWIKAPSWSTSGANNNIFYFADAAANFVTSLYVDTAGVVWLNVQDNVTFPNLVQNSTAGIPTGGWHHLVVTRNGPTVVMYLDGVVFPSAVFSTNNQAGFTPFLAQISNIAAPYGGFFGNMQHAAIYPAALTAAQVAAHYGIGTLAQQTSGARIAALLAGAAVPTVNATIAAGNSQVQAETQPQTGDFLSYLQTVERTEDGLFFFDTAGQPRFVSRGVVYTTVTSTVTFGDGGGAEIPFEPGPQIATDLQDVYTLVTVQRNNGVAQTAGLASPTSPYATRTQQISGLMQTSDVEVAGYANWQLGRFATPKPRIRQITVHPLVDPTGAAATALLGLELGAVVTVNRHTLPGGGTPFTQMCNVEGINFHVYPETGDWNVELQLTPLAPQRPWILGVSQLGVDTTLFF